MRTRDIAGEPFSVIGLGGFELGDDPRWAGARDVVGAALDAGIDWIDTAEAYSDRKNEPVIAAALRDVGRGMKISSKVAPAPGGSGFEPEQIVRACSESRERLGVERLDMYLMHYPGGRVPIEESWAAMRQLVADGAIARAGLSNFSRGDIERCLAVGPVDLLQEGLSPIDHLDTLSLAKWCAQRGIAVVTYEPLANGMLAGAIHRPEDLERVVGEDYREWPFWQRLFSPGRFERSEVVRDRMREIADGVGCSLPQLALAWNVHQEGVSATLAGTTNPDHARSNAEAGDIELTPGQLAELDELISLGPTFADRSA